MELISIQGFALLLFMGAVVLSLVGLIEGDQLSPLNIQLAVLFATAVVHAPAQLLAYWLAVQHALWLG